MVLLALSRARASDAAAQQACQRRALDWLLAMQSRDGGWAAFDADNNWEFLSHVPFADHNAMLDPTCADITGRVLEALAAHGLGREPSGRSARRGLAGAHAAAGWKLVRPLGRGVHLRHLLRAARTCAPPARTTAKPTCCAPANGCAPFRTPMAAGAKAAPATTTAPSRPPRARLRRRPGPMLGLIAGGDTTSLSVQHGIEYLLETQRPDGSWDEELATGTGFPKVFYLNLSLLQGLYFPLLALAEFAKLEQTQERRSTNEISAFHDRRHGRVHFQEQDAAAAGVAEDRGRRRRTPRTRSASCPPIGRRGKPPAASHDPQALPASC